MKSIHLIIFIIALSFSGCTFDKSIPLTSVISEANVQTILTTDEPFLTKDCEFEEDEVLFITEESLYLDKPIYTEAERDIGPSAFFVNNDLFYLLDQWNQAIRIFRNNEEINYLTLNSEISGVDFMQTQKDGLFIICYPYNAGIYVYENDLFRKLNNVGIEDLDNPNQEVHTFDEYVLLNQGTEYLSPVDQYKQVRTTGITFDNTEIEIEINDNTFKCYVSDNAEYYRALNFMRDCIYLEVYEKDVQDQTKRFIVEVDTINMVIKKYPIRKKTISVHRDLFISKENEVYQIIFVDNGIKINKLVDQND